jgi:hypothetical protein
MRVLFALLLAAGCGSHREDGPRATAPEPAPPAITAPAVALPSRREIELPDGKPGIGFDDLQYSPRLNRVLAPAGRTGKLALIDPDSHAVTAIGGFSAAPAMDGGHDFGITSVADTGTQLAVTDRTREELVLVDVEHATIAARVKLAGGPDYVRWVAPTHELWVTEPDKEQIEVFSATPEHIAVIAVRGGPESLVIDAAHGRAYTHLWDGGTVAIDLATRKVGPVWKNGCEGSRGIEIDPQHQLLFAGCADGAVHVLSTTDGKDLGMIAPVRGMDIIAWSPRKRHLYLSGSSSADVAIVGVSDRGELRLIVKAAGAPGGHCVTTDDAGHAFVCDPRGGRLVTVDDTY